MDKKIRKLQAKIRKLSWYDKIVLMDWINAWYTDYKIQQENELKQMYGEEYEMYI